MLPESLQERWGDELKLAEDMFIEAGVELHLVPWTLIETNKLVS